jgi:hypothetical protein
VSLHHASFAGLAAAALLVAPPMLRAQDSSVVHGDRVRFDAYALVPGVTRFEGWAWRPTATMLHFTPYDSSEALMVPLEGVVHLERYAGRRSKASKGAVWGTAIGAGLGLLAGMASTYDESTCGDGAFDCVYAGPTLLGGAIGAASGALIGLGVGALIRKDRWVPIEPTDLPRPSLR